MNMHKADGLVGAETLEIVSDAERLAAIAPAWDALWRQAAGLIFQSHAWIAGWWQTAPDRGQRQLRIGLIWNGDRLVGVMPLCIARRRGLRFLEWAANSYSDYEDILAVPECRPAAQARLWAQLTAAGGFDIALLNRLRPNALARDLERSNVPLKLVPNHRNEVSYRVTGDWSTGDAWFNSQSKRTRKNYRHGHNVLAEEGATQFRLLAADEPVAPVLERLATLKRQWLVARGHKSALFDEGDRVLVALVDALAKSGMLRIFVFEVAGEIAAISVNFVQHGAMMAFLTTYDPQYERASPGTLLMTDYIKWSFDNGLHTVDFLCGAEPFKTRFATTHVTLDTLIAPASMRGRAALLLDGAQLKLAQWRQARAQAKQQAGLDDGAAAD